MYTSVTDACHFKENSYENRLATEENRTRVQFTASYDSAEVSPLPVRCRAGPSRSTCDRDSGSLHCRQSE